jgi:hypothetical protein
MSGNYSDGDRVRHRDWNTTGTVRLFSAAEPGEAAGEVQWDDSVVACELDLVADRLDPLN